MARSKNQEHQPHLLSFRFIRYRFNPSSRMVYKNHCGPYIREARLSKGWLEADLARELEVTESGLNESVIGQIERRERKVYDEELILIASALGVPIQSLVPKRIKPES